MKGGLEMRMTPLRRPAAATTLNTPHRSLRMNMESTITITGLENRMVVESPSGSREKLVKMKRIRSPPVTATAVPRTFTLLLMLREVKLLLSYTLQPNA